MSLMRMYSSGMMSDSEPPPGPKRGRAVWGDDGLLVGVRRAGVEEGWSRGEGR